MEIRQATTQDLDQIIAIWKDGIGQQYGNSDIDDNYLHEEFEKQIKSQNGTFKFWVGILDNKIAGWQAISPFHPSPNPIVRNGFAQSQTYIRNEYRKEGVGKNLLSHALKFCKENTEIKYVFGLVLSSNTTSLQIGAHFGFINLGTLPETSRHFSNFDLLVYPT